MADGNNPQQKKNPAPMAKMGHRKKKQQAAPAVKIPQGNKYRLR